MADPAIAPTDPGQPDPAVPAWLIRWRRPFIVALHIGVMAMTSYAAIWLRFDGDIPPINWTPWVRSLPWLLVLRGLVFWQFGLYHGLWRYAGLWDLRRLAGASVLSTALFYVLVHWVIGWREYPRAVFVVDTALLIMALGGLRVMRRVMLELTHGQAGRRVLVYGAGDAGEMIVRDMRTQSSYVPIGFVDDDPGKQGQRIHGVPVLGKRADLPALLARHRPAELLIAIPSASPADTRAIVRSLESFKIPIKTLPNLRDLRDGRIDLGDIRNLSVDDLLVRAPVGLDGSALHQLITGRRILVTGAGGSIGSELCRQLAPLSPASLVMLDRYENGLHAIRVELDQRARGVGLHPLIADITDEGRIDEVMRTYLPEIVFHAAAHKHVPLMEENPCEAIKNNVRGTRVMLEAAQRYRVDRFVLVSTDKAVNPSSVMGASKRLAELLLQVQSSTIGTACAIVRFGNVLGSNGSVVPLFLEQIKRGGPVTVTHPEIRRFFMLIPEAVQLVLHAAAQSEASGTYVLDMGEQVKLVDLAGDLIRLSGLAPEDDIRIEFVGLRPGEKLYEELVGVGETVGPSKVKKILKVTSRTRPQESFLRDLLAVEALAARGDRAGTLDGIRRLVPEFAEQPVSAGMPAALSPLPDGDTMPAVAQSMRHVCPSCRGSQVHRSRARSVIERLQRDRRVERLYRCDDCGWRGWLLPLESPVGEVRDFADVSSRDLT